MNNNLVGDFTMGDFLILESIMMVDEELRAMLLPTVDVFVTLECIHLGILCIVTRCLFRDVSIMYLSHVVMPQCSDREDQ